MESSRIPKSISELKAKEKQIYLKESRILLEFYEKETGLFAKKTLISCLIFCLDEYIKEGRTSYNYIELYKAFYREFRNEIQYELIDIYKKHLRNSHAKYDHITNRIIVITFEMKVELLENYMHFLESLFENLVHHLKSAKKLDDIKSLKDKWIKENEGILIELKKVQVEKEKHHTQVIEARNELERIEAEIEISGGLPTLCFKGSIIDVENYLMDYGDEKVNEMNQHGELPLHRACEGGHLEIVKFLIDKGADPKILDNKNKDGERFSAFHYACGPGPNQGAILGYLCHCDWIEGDGLALNIMSEHKKTLLHFATLHNRKSIVTWLLSKTFAKSSIMYFFEIYHDKIDVNAQDKTGFTCLHIAASQGYDAITKILLDNNANVALKDNQDLNALQIALLKQRTEVLRVFFNEGYMLSQEEVDFSISKLPIHEQKQVLNFLEEILAGYGNESFLQAVSDRQIFPRF